MGKFKCSFGQWLIDNFGCDAIEKYWSVKNTISPFEIGRNSTKDIWLKCDKPGHLDYCRKPYNIKSSKALCPVCSNRQIIPGINDIATTHPDFVQYFKDKSCAMKYSYSSGKRCDFICPDCGSVKEGFICNVVLHGFWCPVCGRGVSYPNKFISSLLMQLSHINHRINYFDREHIFDWAVVKNHPNEKLCGQKVYDFFIHDDNILIECNGGQHYGYSSFNNCGKTLQEEQENDKLKYLLAIENGIVTDNYIVIDCRQSNANFIKNSVMHSSLPDKLGFTESDIDWDMCDSFASTNVFLETCRLWNDGVHNIKEIASRLHISEWTIPNYLNKGLKLGMCDYEPRRNIPILCLNNQLVFENSTICSNNSVDIFGVAMRRKDINRAAKDGIRLYQVGFQYITRAEYKRICKEDPWRTYTSNKTNNNTK